VPPSGDCHGKDRSRCRHAGSWLIERCTQMLRHLVAEGVGFEPTELSLYGFQDRRLKPLGHPSDCSTSQRYYKWDNELSRYHHCRQSVRA
jgi:hypothetical protein